jgi:EAL domain-containing protein (putative c-di-GMP-specific phosphodiesterase class I)
VIEVAEMTRALRRALSRDELAAWFQPQIDVQSGEIVAAEALCRWHHPAWGVVKPNEFIPVAEETGLIDEVGEFMAIQALSAVTEWEIDVSVNVSPAQLEDAGFTTWLAPMIHRLRRPARRLTLEITEGRHLDDVPALVARLDGLRAMGVGIAIDDYGAGQASLTQAKRLHATELKIDRSLIIDETETTFREVTDAVELAHDAGMRVVAEGVETTSQFDRVARLGCDRAQGFLWSRPVPRAEMARLLATA